MGSMSCQSLKWLRPTVLEMYLQEKALFNLALGVTVTLNVAQCPLHHVTYAHAKFKVATTKGEREDAFTRNTLFDLNLGVKVTGNVSQYPLHYVNYAPVKFEVAASKG